MSDSVQEVPDSSDWPKLIDLLRQPRTSDPEWHEEVARTMMDLPMELLDTEQTFRGPDGLAYFRVSFPRSDGPFPGMTLREAVSFPAKSYFGLALVDDRGEPRYVFTHGDLVSLREFGKLDVGWDAPWDRPSTYDTTQALQIEAGEPSLDMLPESVRESVRTLYGLFGNHEPRVTLIRLAGRASHEAASDLVFDVPDEMFGEPRMKEWFQKVAIYAFLPRHLQKRTIAMDRRMQAFPL